MPLYEYQSQNPGALEESCRICSKGFELRRPVDRAPLEVCPLCRNPIKKLISSVNTAKTYSIRDAKQAGFTVLERKDDGNFEKQ